MRTASAPHRWWRLECGCCWPMPMPRRQRVWWVVAGDGSAASGKRVERRVSPPIPGAQLPRPACPSALLVSGCRRLPRRDETRRQRHSPDNTPTTTHRGGTNTDEGWTSHRRSTRGGGGRSLTVNGDFRFDHRTFRTRRQGKAKGAQDEDLLQRCGINTYSPRVRA